MSLETTINSYINDVNEYEVANETNWVDLDDEDEFNNHFLKGQCGVGVVFNNGSESGAFDKWHTLPVYPNEVGFNGSTNFNSAEILGRPGTISGYVSTSDVTTKISFELHRELLIPSTNRDVGVREDINKVDQIISFIQACNYPKRIENGLLVPIVTYIFGDTAITGKQTSFDVSWGGPKIANKYMHAKINVGITHTPSGIIYFDDVVNTNPRKWI